MFRAHDDKLSYYDMFQFFDNQMKLKLENW